MLPSLAIYFSCNKYASIRQCVDTANSHAITWASITDTSTMICGWLTTQRTHLWGLANSTKPPWRAWRTHWYTITTLFHLSLRCLRRHTNFCVWQFSALLLLQVPSLLPCYCKSWESEGQEVYSWCQKEQNVENETNKVLLVIISSRDWLLFLSIQQIVFPRNDLISWLWWA